jgi:hypothetical protein
MTSIDSLLTLAETYCVATGLAEATVSTRVMKDGKRLDAIRAGKDIGARRLAEAIQWFSDNWPADVTWPDSIARPTPTVRERAPA